MSEAKQPSLKELAENPSNAGDLAKFRDGWTAAVTAAANLYGEGDVAAPVGNSTWGEAHQQGWIDGTQAYRDAIRRLDAGRGER
jgi:membrane carboxypeptidase/penicillin-binding protein PbpC